MTNLCDLPTELLFLIADQLPLSDAVKWSSCSKLFRSSLAPLVYKTVAFGNGQDSAGVALKAVKDNGSLVRKLIFSCIVNADIYEDCKYAPRSGLLSIDEEDEETTDSVDGEDLSLSAVASSLLKGDHTPNASALVIRICLEYWSVPRFDEHFEPTDNNVGGTMQAESKNGSPVLMGSVWDAVAENENITTLEVPTLMPKSASIFETPKFERFLGGLHDIKFTVFGVHGEDGSALACTGYSNFLHDLRRLFLSRTRNLRRLRLECAPDSLIGLGKNREDFIDNDNEADNNDDVNHIPLPLPASVVMPELRSLELFRSFICPELITFIGHHQASLRSLHLNCVAPSRGRSAITWEVFFIELADLKTGLSELIVNPWDGNSCDIYQPRDGLFFTYGYLTEGGSTFFTDETFAEGRDRQDGDRQAYSALKMLIDAEKIEYGLRPGPQGQRARYV